MFIPLRPDKDCQWFRLTSTDTLHVRGWANFSGSHLFIVYQNCDITVHVFFTDPNIGTTAEVSRDDGDGGHLGTVPSNVAGELAQSATYRRTDVSERLSIILSADITNFCYHSP